MRGVTPPASHPQVVEADVAVIGGGLGGIAAALTIAAAGYRVVVTEPCDRVGGQVTTQGVAALDEHPLIERAGRTETYARFRDAVRRRYHRAGAPEQMPDGGPLNPGNGWVSRLCFEPAVGQAVLDDLLQTDGGDGLAVLTGHHPAAVDCDGDDILAVALHHRDTAGVTRVVRLQATVYVDATELGDLLLLAGAPFTVGAESVDDTGEPGALAGQADPQRVQACTVTAALEFRPREDHTIRRPDDYERWRAAQPFTLSLDNGSRPFHMFQQGPTGLPPFWTYRRLRDATMLGGHDIALINWAGNDYHDRSLIGPVVGPDPVAVTQARRLTHAFVYWLQTEVPRDDGSGAGYPELRLSPETLGTADGLAAHPYVRESRRLRSSRRVREQDVLPDGTLTARARLFPDSGGIGWYHLDLHASVGDPSTRWEQTLPFQIPLGALVAPERPNLIAGGKCLGTTHLTNGAYRVHPVEWATGEAAGALAVIALQAARSPAALVDDARGIHRVQDHLLRHGAPVFWFDDLTPAHDCWRPAQLLAAAGGLRHDRHRTQTLQADERRPLDAVSRRSLTRAAEAIVGHDLRDLQGLGNPPEEMTWEAHVMGLAPWLDATISGGARVRG